MPKFIDRDKALSFPLANGKYDHEHANEHFIYGLETYKEWLEQLPSLSPDEVRGVGKLVDNGVRAWSCSCCGTPLNHIRQFASFEKNELPNYCPNCGARLEVSEDE